MLCVEGVLLHSALKMGFEREGTKSGGYVGGFFQLFDWTSKSRKKLFAAKSDLPGKFTVFIEHTGVFISLVNLLESVTPKFYGSSHFFLYFTVGDFFSFSKSSAETLKQGRRVGYNVAMPMTQSSCLVLYVLQIHLLFLCIYLFYEICGYFV